MTWNNHPRGQTDGPCSWAQQGSMGVLAEDTAVGVEVSIYEYWPATEEWDRRYTMDQESAEDLLAVLERALEMWDDSPVTGDEK